MDSSLAHFELYVPLYLGGSLLTVSLLCCSCNRLLLSGRFGYFVPNFECFQPSGIKGSEVRSDLG